ncbi:class I SAM-dependent methyltransferase [Prochlorothrix hollandica]|uniref:Methyltransferase domain-containing protein n=1 Tax=Prochlorothrix hollandica PCC 9006 = CALU 1027 TaxID=317619 RepID=A0A0M2PZ12_PROHO|nr:class I SAM-dependent methyltransferase [Prochlorothrix hollandica]KKJ01686.1 hypothetical protein PROH_03400 [Prochlorothrix hollandica PCC 9006 = CALU 1027]
MDRILEPEIMDDRPQAIAYAQADFRDSNRRFIDSLIHSYPQYLRHILDLGCGPGDIALELARSLPECQVTALDASAPMVELAQARLTAAALGDRVTLLQGQLPHWPSADFRTQPAFSALISKDMLHHLPQPHSLWSSLLHLRHSGHTTTPVAVSVMDLRRPPSPAAAQAIVAAIAPTAPDILQRDFYNSLCAAFTVGEVQQQLRDAGLSSLEVVLLGDRHLWVRGVLF